MCLSTQELKKKKKQWVNLESPRPMAARLKKKKKTAGKPRTASAYGRAVKKKKTACKPRTASAYGRAVKKKKKQRVNLEPPRPMAARLIMHKHMASYRGVKLGYAPAMRHADKS